MMLILIMTTKPSFGEKNDNDNIDITFSVFEVSIVHSCLQESHNKWKYKN